MFTKYPHRNWRFINIFKSIPCYPRHPELIAISECLMRYMRTIFMIQNAKSSVFFGVADEIIRQLSTNSQRAPVCELCAALYSIEHCEAGTHIITSVTHTAQLVTHTPPPPTQTFQSPETKLSLCVYNDLPKVWNKPINKHHRDNLFLIRRLKVNFYINSVKQSTYTRPI